LIKDDTINILAEPVREVVCPECEHAIDVSEMDMLAAIKCPECGEDLTVPARLGDFILVEALGSGGMATVYKAYDESLGRYVAVKIMRRKFGQDPKFVERFLKEARAAARINHPNVVQIYSCAARNGQPYIVMELVNGEKFDNMIAEQAPMPERRVIDIAIDIANGLRAASDIGLVHGDIKPANIIFDRNGMAKVADFGLAHFAQEHDERSEIWGTPYYIAPERARKKSQDSRSDIYCLGATLFHALAGEPPFDGETAVDVVMERLKHPAPDLAEIVPGISEGAAKVVGRMLEMEKIRRYPNYNSLLSDLEKAKSEIGSGSESAKKVPRKTGKHKDGENKPGGKKIGARLAIILASLLILAGALYGGWLLMDRMTASEEPEEEPMVEQTVPAEEPLQPFDAERDARLSNILGEMKASTSIASERDLFHFAQGLNENDARRMWCRLLGGVAAILQGKDDKAQGYYDEVATAEGGEEASELPRSLAKFMSGQSESSTAPEGEEWPQWYSDLALLFEGIRELGLGKSEEAVSNLDQYAETEAAGQASWPYSLKGFAEDLARRIRAWQKISASADDMAAKNNFDQALKLLRDRVKTGLFIPLRDSKIEEITAAQKEYQDAEKSKAAAAKAQAEEAARKRRQEEEERKAREAAEQAEKIAAEEKMLEAWEQRAAPLLKANRFDQAEDLLEKLENEITNQSVKQTLEARAVAVERLSALKDFLVSSINSRSYAGGQNILRGKAVSATSQVIIVELAGGVGQTNYDWSRVGPRLVFPMAKYYMSRSDLDAERQAELLMGLAEYAAVHELGVEKRFKDMAEKVKPGISSGD